MTKESWDEAAKRIIKQSEDAGEQEIWEKFAEELKGKMPKFFYLDAVARPGQGHIGLPTYRN